MNEREMYDRVVQANIALHEIVDPAALSGADILDRVDRPFSRDRLAAGLDRIESHQRQLSLAA